MKSLILSFIFFLAIGHCLAENSLFDEKKLEDIKKQIDALNKITPESYVEVINEKTKDIDEFLIKKQKVCLGEFSTIVLSDGGELNPGEAKKLSDNEREICLKDLKRLQLSYINNLYRLKKSYIDYLYKERLKNLEVARQEELKKFR